MRFLVLSLLLVELSCLLVGRISRLELVALPLAFLFEYPVSLLLLIEALLLSWGQLFVLAVLLGESAHFCQGGLVSLRDG